MLKQDDSRISMNSGLAWAEQRDSLTTQLCYCALRMIYTPIVTALGNLRQKDGKFEVLYKES